MQILQARERKIKGKRVKTLREEGFLPAVLYGAEIDSRPLAVDYKDFEKTYRQSGESSLLELRVDGKSYNVLIHGIAYDPLKGNPMHADFYAVRMDRTIRTKVHLEFIGESPAVKNEGGILLKVMQEIEVEAFPQNLPHEIKVDISPLDSVGTRIFVKNIILPQGVRVVADAEEVVVLVEAPRAEEEIAAPEAAPAEVKTEREVREELKEKEKGDKKEESEALEKEK